MYLVNFYADYKKRCCSTLSNIRNTPCSTRLSSSLLEPSVRSCLFSVCTFYAISIGLTGLYVFALRKKKKKTSKMSPSFYLERGANGLTRKKCLYSYPKNLKEEKHFEVLVSAHAVRQIMARNPLQV